jgi:rubrerythrin
MTSEAAAVGTLDDGTVSYAPLGEILRDGNELVAELHPDRNPGIDPTTLGAGSGLKAWWQCPECGHQWTASVTNWTNGSGCPVCARKPKHHRSADRAGPH